MCVARQLSVGQGVWCAAVRCLFPPAERALGVIGCHWSSWGPCRRVCACVCTRSGRAIVQANELLIGRVCVLLAAGAHGCEPQLVLAASQPARLAVPPIPESSAADGSWSCSGLHRLTAAARGTPCCPACPIVSFAAWVHSRSAAPNVYDHTLPGLLRSRTRQPSIIKQQQWACMDCSNAMGMHGLPCKTSKL